MQFRFKTTMNDFPKMEKALEEVSGKSVNVGVLGGGEQAWLAGIHEFGCHITPGKAEYLTVPLTEEAAGKKANSFADTFVYTSKNGKKFIARSVNGELELLYWLTKEVNIPERSFLRNGFDENAEEIVKKARPILADVLGGTMSEEQYFKMIGQLLSSKIKEYATNLSDPPKSSITTSAHPGFTNPLVMSGDMIGAITYEVEDNA